MKTLESNKVKSGSLLAPVIGVLGAVVVLGIAAYGTNYLIKRNKSVSNMSFTVIMN